MFLYETILAEIVFGRTMRDSEEQTAILLSKLRNSMTFLTIFQLVLHFVSDSFLSASLLSAWSFLLITHHRARVRADTQTMRSKGTMKDHLQLFSTTLLALLRIGILSQSETSESTMDMKTANLFVGYVILLIAFSDNCTMVSCLGMEPVVLRRRRRVAPAG